MFFDTSGEAILTGIKKVVASHFTLVLVLNVFFDTSGEAIHFTLVLVLNVFFDVSGEAILTGIKLEGFAENPNEGSSETKPQRRKPKGERG